MGEFEQIRNFLSFAQKMFHITLFSFHLKKGSVVTVKLGIPYDTTDEGTLSIGQSLLSPEFLRKVDSNEI